jgi:hypothetical protein
MKRKLLILFTLLAMLACMPLASAEAAGGVGRLGGGRGRGGHGHGHFNGGIGRLGGHGRFSSHGHGHGGHGFGFGSGFGLGFGGGYGGYGWDIAELYRQLYNNLPYFALHPPVYYSYPVPRTYGYSPFAYPPGVMTPDAAGVQPLEIMNPYVPTPQEKPVSVKKDSTAAASAQPEPLVIVNPFVAPNRAVARTAR